MSIVAYTFSMPVPFRGGRSSKEKIGLVLLFIISITLMSGFSVDI
jgi:hypothetical protein